jgi:hypothetical protein
MSMFERTRNGLREMPSNAAWLLSRAPKPAQAVGDAAVGAPDHMAITEMPDAGEPADATGCRLVHAAPLDRVYAMRPPTRRALLRPVIAHRHVNSLVVDGAAPTVWPRIEE